MKCPYIPPQSLRSWSSDSRLRHSKTARHGNCAHLQGDMFANISAQHHSRQQDSSRSWGKAPQQYQIKLLALSHRAWKGRCLRPRHLLDFALEIDSSIPSCFWWQGSKTQTYFRQHEKPGRFCRICASLLETNWMNQPLLFLFVPYHSVLRQNISLFQSTQLIQFSHIFIETPWSKKNGSPFSSHKMQWKPIYDYRLKTQS